MKITKTTMYHLISRKSGMLVASHDDPQHMPLDRVRFEVLTDDELQERATQWADREGVDLGQAVEDQDGDLYVRVETEDGTEALYVDYSPIV